MSDVETRSRRSTGDSGEGRYAPSADAIEVAFRTTDDPPDVAATVAAVPREENG